MTCQERRRLRAEYVLAEMPEADNDLTKSGKCGPLVQLKISVQILLYFCDMNM